ncbi:MAG: fumarylacetoacetate hydrolase family protein [Actinomycetota bacterium]
MAVNVARYRAGESIGWAVVDGTMLRPIEGRYPTTATFISDVADAVLAGDAPTAEPIALDDVSVLSPVTTNQQFLCQAINYRSHMEESGLDPETSPFNIFFRKASSCLAPPDTDIVVPAHVEFCDYEVEIGVVLRRTVSQPMTISHSNLRDHIAALVVVNDISARDVQLPEGQFYKGKSYRTFGPAGPWLTLVDADDLARFDELRLRLSVNDEVRQDGSASEMIHKPAATLTELSTVQDWGPGDLLATGTPGGCALQAPPKPIAALVQAVSPKRRAALLRRSAARTTRRLVAGDVITTTIGTGDGAIDLGEQRTTVVTDEGSYDVAHAGR